MAQSWFIDERLNSNCRGKGGLKPLKNEKGPLSWLQQLLNKNKDQKDKKPSMYVYVFIVIILGVGIMLASNLFTANQTGQTRNFKPFLHNNKENKDAEAFGQKTNDDFKTTRDYEIYLQNEMKEAS